MVEMEGSKTRCIAWSLPEPAASGDSLSSSVFYYQSKPPPPVQPVILYQRYTVHERLFVFQVSYSVLRGPCLNLLCRGEWILSLVFSLLCVPAYSFPCTQLPSATLRGFDNPTEWSVPVSPRAFALSTLLLSLFKDIIVVHGGPADPFGGTPGGTPKRGTPQGRVPHRVGSAGGTPSRGLPQGVPHRVG